jgi:putative RNA 2'-phosphotransferase
MKINLVELSQVISHALRHEPWLYELELDDEGWVSVESLLYGLRSLKTKWGNLRETDIIEMINKSDKKRHEIKDDKIRALYGHTIPGKLIKMKGNPPDILYHGTTNELLKLIQTEGLKPMHRHYVHLSVNPEIAKQVGLRKDPEPVIVSINTQEASKCGIVFYQGNELVWLVDHMPAKYLDVSSL